MPDEEQNNGQTPPTPDELPTPMPQPDEQSTESTEELPKPMAESETAEQPASEPSFEQPMSESEIEPTTEAPAPSETTPETPVTQPAAETDTSEPASTPESELDSLPPAEAPMPTLGEEEPVTAQDPFTTAQTVHPDTSANAATSMTAAQAPAPVKKKKGKKGIILGVIITIFALLIGGTASGYFLWYQNPDKVVMDTIVGVVSSDTANYVTTVRVATSSTDVLVEIDGQFNQDASNNDVKLMITSKGSGVIDVGDITSSGKVVIARDGTMYIKINDLQASYESVRDAVVQSIAEQSAGHGVTLTSTQIEQYKSIYDGIYSPLIEKMDGEWIETDAYDLEDEISSLRGGGLYCAYSLIKRAIDSGTFSDDILSAYREYPFLAVSENLGINDGSQGYALTYDSETANDFIAVNKNTRLAEYMLACNTRDEFLDMKRIELWADHWSHALTRIVLESETVSGSTITLDVKFDPNKVPDITIPTDTITIKDIREDSVDGFFSSFFSM